MMYKIIKIKTMHILNNFLKLNSFTDTQTHTLYKSMRGYFILETLTTFSQFTIQ